MVICNSLEKVDVFAIHDVGSKTEEVSKRRVGVKEETLNDVMEYVAFDRRPLHLRFRERDGMRSGVEDRCVLGVCGVVVVTVITAITATTMITVITMITTKIICDVVNNRWDSLTKTLRDGIKDALPL